MKDQKITYRTKINRQPKRASYDRETIFNILDSSFICHVGFKIEDEVYIIPTAFGRKDNTIFIHGSLKSRMLNALKAGDDICITVTLLDGIVLARSAFHHSFNYRSVVIFSKGKEIIGNNKKLNSLKIISDNIIPGRWEDVRQPNEKELNATSVFEFKIDEASAKIRTGAPIDEKEDYDLKVWAGIIPIKTTLSDPIKDPALNENILFPDYLKHYKT